MGCFDESQLFSKMNRALLSDDPDPGGLMFLLSFLNDPPVFFCGCFLTSPWYAPVAVHGLCAGATLHEHVASWKTKKPSTPASSTKTATRAPFLFSKLATRWHLIFRLTAMKTFSIFWLWHITLTGDETRWWKGNLHRIHFGAMGMTIQMIADWCHQRLQFSWHLRPQYSR